VIVEDILMGDDQNDEYRDVTPTTSMPTPFTSLSV